MGCAPSVYQAAYGTGVAVATRGEDPPAIIETVDDRSITLAINRAWLDASRTRFADLDVSVSKGVVSLTGMVGSPDHLVEALEIVWRQDGVVSVKSNAAYGASETDNTLAVTIRERLSADPDILTDRYTVKVFDENVYVIGKARNKEELDRSFVTFARPAPFAAWYPWSPSVRLGYDRANGHVRRRPGIA